MTPYCDFCYAVLDEGQQRKYPARDFEALALVGAPRMSFIGAFLACPDCAALIDGDKWENLLDRALDRFCKRHGIHDHEDRAILRTHLADFHRRFREARLPYDSDN